MGVCALLLAGCVSDSVRPAPPTEEPARDRFPRLLHERMPDREYLQISKVSGGGLCAIDAAGLIVCTPWIAYDDVAALATRAAQGWTVVAPLVYAEFEAPSGLPFVRVMASTYTCGIDSAGAIFCWALPGFTDPELPDLRPLTGEGPFAAVTGNWLGLFAISEAGVAHFLPTAVPPQGGCNAMPPQLIGAPLATVDSVETDLLVVDVEGHLSVLNFCPTRRRLQSWFFDTDGLYTAARASTTIACASRRDAGLWCGDMNPSTWSPGAPDIYDELGLPADYEGEVFGVDIGPVCLAASPGIVCSDGSFPVSPPSEGTFVQIETLANSGCGLRDDGRIICWDNNSG